MTDISLTINVHQGLPLNSILSAFDTASFAVLHAAIYSNFAENCVGIKLQKKLANGLLQQLYILQLQPHQLWKSEFAAILRPHHKVADIAHLYHHSYSWSEHLQSNYPQQVHFMLTQTLPLQPILLIGNRIFAGQYSHSHTASSSGIWLEIKLPNEHEIAARFLDPKQQSPIDIAFLRFIDECSFAYQHSLYNIKAD